jgi:hypothetical protein
MVRRALLPNWPPAFELTNDNAAGEPFLTSAP